jgi:acyl carrier protein
VTETEQKVIAYLESITPSATARYTPETPIFATGLFDSLALVQLVAWVEEETGEPIDPAEMDFRAEWETVAHVASFVERLRAA